MNGTRYKNKPLEIPTDDPFKYDALGRKESAEILTQFISSIREPFVLAVDSAWGTGKTTFIKMWKQHLVGEGYKCIYFNAWENDFSDDPLVSLIGEVGASLDSLGIDKTKKAKVKTIFNKIKKDGAKLAANAAQVVIKNATSGILDIEKLKNKEIENYKTKKELLGEFRKKLGDLVLEIRGTEKKNSSKPLIFFIDELDRCKPTYAIELLERLKHLFNIDGIVFVISIDKKQLSNIVKVRYGHEEEMDAVGYLRRMIDLDYRLPEPDRKLYFDYLCKKYKIETLFSLGNYEHYNSEHVKLSIVGLFDGYKASLRDMEHYFSYLNIIRNCSSQGEIMNTLFLTIFLAIKLSDTNKYNEIVERKIALEALNSYLETIQKENNFMDFDYWGFLNLGLFVAFSENKVVHDELKRLETRRDNLYKNQTTDAYKKAKKVEDDMSLIAHFQEVNRNGGLFEKLVKKIEIAERFVDSPDSKPAGQ
jgi:hypothetical protein